MFFSPITAQQVDKKQLKSTIKIEISVENNRIFLNTLVYPIPLMINCN